nr:protein turtle homolog A [Nothobranchius furzeri]
MGSARSYWQTFAVVALICHSFNNTEGVRPEVHGKVGASMELECRFLSSGPAAVSTESQHVVEWIRQGLDVPVLIKFGSYAPRVHPRYEGRVSLVKTTTLRLERLQLDDQGLYDCRILLLDKPTDELQNSSWTLLSVAAPPTFTKAPPPVFEALVGSPLSLDCVVDGNPTPTITWLKDGSLIQGLNFQGGVLFLPAVTAQSAGQYTCHASNSEGNLTRVTTVKIKGPPVILVPPKDTTLNMSQNALLQCQAVADPPNMTYVWQKGGENVHHIESLKSRVKIMVDGTLLISGLIPKDSGNYTCVPTNGLLSPPAASAVLKVMHPALALQMPQETYLPTGRGGAITCPVSAQPPLLRVEWTKDGGPLDLSLYPGWTLKADGSVVMATVNEDAAGVYTCMPYNSYGSMGSSGPTRIVLQDPPSFSTNPEKEYKQETGRSLIIPCQGNVDPTIKVTWSKVDLVRTISYSIEPNGSLLLQPVIKDHQGEWECSISNRVASIKARTRVFVLGTSPHAATSLSVSPGVKEANISWEAGFDGGSAQTFSVWVKRISVGDNDGKQDWFSVPVLPSSGTSLLVSGLSPATDYQFSILSQNKIGAGPFSEITTARTLSPPERRSKLKPPASLSANQGSAGVILQWSLPEAQQPPITGFVLQTRTAEGEWLNLDEHISANSSQMLVQGLQTDCVYELRMFSRRGELLSEPSPSVNISTAGMESSPSTSRLLEFVPEPLLAGVLAGVGFMCLALVLLLGSACIISRKRDQRRRQKKDDPLPAIYKCSPSVKTSGSSSPDSLLKKSLLPTNSLYPTTSSITSSMRMDTSSSSTNNHHHHHRHTHLLSNSNRLTKTTSLISPPIEMISRGPDGRFLLPTYEDDDMSVGSKNSLKYDQHTRVRRSVSLHLEREDTKKEPYVLSVDFPPCKNEVESTNQMFNIGNNSPCVMGQRKSYDPDQSSLYSSSSVDTIPHHNGQITPVFPVLPHIRAGFGQPSTTASSLVLQMEHERERGNLSRCLKLAQEREELELELRRYTLERNSFKGLKREQITRGAGEESGEDLWRYKSNTLPNKYHQNSKGDSYSSSSVHWEAHSHNSQPTLIQTRDYPSSTPTLDPSRFATLPPTFAKQTSHQPEEVDAILKDGLTLPHLPSKHQIYRRLLSSPDDYENSTQSTVLGISTADLHSEAQRLNNQSHGSLSTLSFHSNKYSERCNFTLEEAPDTLRLEVAFPGPSDKDTSVEMCVDEPEFEVYRPQLTKPMLHHRIASHLQHGCPLTQRGRCEDLKKSLNASSPVSVDNIDRAHHSRMTSEPEFWRPQSRSSKIWDRKQRSQSLDLRRQKKTNTFLTPDAWIDSLSQENCSVSPSHLPDSLRTSYPTIQRNSQPSPAVDHLALGAQRLAQSRAESRCCEPLRYASILPDGAHQPVPFQGPLMKVSSYLPPFNSDHEALAVDAEVSEGVPESGSSYSSYASSGRGSMETANGSPETVEDTRRCSVGKHNQHVEPWRKPSVDESYEWDAADFSSKPAEHDGRLPSLNLQKQAACRGLPSMQCISAAQRKSSLPGHPSSRSAEPEPAAVLF